MSGYSEMKEQEQQDMQNGSKQIPLTSPLVQGYNYSPSLDNIVPSPMKMETESEYEPMETESEQIGSFSNSPFEQPCGTKTGITDYNMNGNENSEQPVIEENMFCKEQDNNFSGLTGENYSTQFVEENCNNNGTETDIQEDHHKRSIPMSMPKNWMQVEKLKQKQREMMHQHGFLQETAKESDNAESQELVDSNNNALTSNSISDDSTISIEDINDDGTLHLRLSSTSSDYDSESSDEDFGKLYIDEEAEELPNIVEETGYVKYDTEDVNNSARSRLRIKPDEKLVDELNKTVSDFREMKARKRTDSDNSSNDQAYKSPDMGNTINDYDCNSQSNNSIINDADRNSQCTNNTYDEFNSQATDNTSENQSPDLNLLSASKINDSLKCAIANVGEYNRRQDNNYLRSSQRVMKRMWHQIQEGKQEEAYKIRRNILQAADGLGNEMVVSQNELDIPERPKITVPIAGIESGDLIGEGLKKQSAERNNSDVKGATEMNSEINQNLTEGSERHNVDSDEDSANDSDEDFDVVKSVLARKGMDLKTFVERFCSDSESDGEKEGDNEDSKRQKEETQCRENTEVETKRIQNVKIAESRERQLLALKMKFLRNRNLLHYMQVQLAAKRREALISSELGTSFSNPHPYALRRLLGAINAAKNRSVTNVGAVSSIENTNASGENLKTADEQKDAQDELVIGLIEKKETNASVGVSENSSVPTEVTATDQKCLASKGIIVGPSTNFTAYPRFAHLNASSIAAASAMNSFGPMIRYPSSSVEVKTSNSQGSMSTAAKSTIPQAVRVPTSKPGLATASEITTVTGQPSFAQSSNQESARPDTILVPSNRKVSTTSSQQPRSMLTTVTVPPNACMTLPIIDNSGRPQQFLLTAPTLGSANQPLTLRAPPFPGTVVRPVLGQDVVTPVVTIPQTTPPRSMVMPIGTLTQQSKMLRHPLALSHLMYANNHNQPYLVYGPPVSTAKANAIQASSMASSATSQLTLTTAAASNTQCSTSMRSILTPYSIPASKPICSQTKPTTGQLVLTSTGRIVSVQLPTGTTPSQTTARTPNTEQQRLYVKSGPRTLSPRTLLQLVNTSGKPVTISLEPAKSTEKQIVSLESTKMTDNSVDVTQKPNNLSDKLVSVVQKQTKVSDKPIDKKSRRQSDKVKSVAQESTKPCNTQVPSNAGIATLTVPCNTALTSHKQVPHTNRPNKLHDLTTVDDKVKAGDKTANALCNNKSEPLLHKPTKEDRNKTVLLSNGKKQESPGWKIERKSQNNTNLDTKSIWDVVRVMEKTNGNGVPVQKLVLRKSPKGTKESSSSEGSPKNVSTQDKGKTSTTVSNKYVCNTKNTETVNEISSQMNSKTSTSNDNSSVVRQNTTGMHSIVNSSMDSHITIARGKKKAKSKSLPASAAENTHEMVELNREASMPNNTVIEKSHVESNSIIGFTNSSGLSQSNEQSRKHLRKYLDRKKQKPIVDVTGTTTNHSQECVTDSNDSYDSSDLENYETFMNEKKSESAIHKRKSELIESYYTAHGRKIMESKNNRPVPSAVMSGTYTTPTVTLSSRASSMTAPSISDDCVVVVETSGQAREDITPDAANRALSAALQTNDNNQKKGKFIKTKFIILKGDICDRWLDIKKRTGFGEMSDPKFVHYLLRLEETRQQKIGLSDHYNSGMIGTNHSNRRTGDHRTPNKYEVSKNNENIQLPKNETSSTSMSNQISTPKNRTRDSNTPDQISTYESSGHLSSPDHTRHTTMPDQINTHENNDCQPSPYQTSYNTTPDQTNTLQNQTRNTTTPEQISNLENQTRHTATSEQISSPGNQTEDRTTPEQINTLQNQTSSTAMPDQISSPESNGHLASPSESQMCVSPEVKTGNSDMTQLNENNNSTVSGDDENGANVNTVEDDHVSPGYQTKHIDTRPQASNHTSDEVQIEEENDAGRMETVTKTTSGKKGYVIVAPELTKVKREKRKRPSVDKYVISPTSQTKKPRFLSKATESRIEWAIKIFREWLIKKGETQCFECQSAKWLDNQLCDFYPTAKCHNGIPYSTNTLQDFRRALSLYLSSYNVGNNVTVSIALDKEYMHSNSILTKLLLYRPASDDSLQKVFISDQDMDKLYQTETLSDKNPVCLSWKVWFDVTYHLCSPKFPSTFWRMLKKHDLRLDSDVDGVFYTFSKHLLPTGAEPSKMYATPNEPEKCPVRTASLYVSKLNSHCEALFQYPRQNWRPSMKVWYSSTGIGQEKLDYMMRKISSQAKLSMMYSNQSVMMTAKLKKNSIL